MTAENARLDEARDRKVPWKSLGPYRSERHWDTVSENHNKGGDAWKHFRHDHARSRAYHWGVDGMAGISHDQQRLCCAVALPDGQRLQGTRPRERRPEAGSSQ